MVYAGIYKPSLTFENIGMVELPELYSDSGERVVSFEIEMTKENVLSDVSIIGLKNGLLRQLWSATCRRKREVARDVLFHLFHYQRLV